MTTIGYMNIIPVETNVLEGSLHIEWKIFNFTSYSDEDGRNYFSPIFTFADERWNLEIYPNGRQKVDSSGYICLYLVKKSSGPSVILEYSLGLKTLNGKKFVEHYRTHKFKRINQAGGVHKCILRSDLLKRSDFLPIDHLTVFCHLKYPKSAVNASNIASAKCSHCKEIFAAESLSSHEKKCMDKPIKCPECSNIDILRNWYDHVCETEKNAKDDGSLCQDYRKVLLSGRNHDLILKVGDKEIRAHKDILRARSRIFESMLDHDMKEKNSGVIDIPDCNPQAMKEFLSYVYCGKVETLDQSNMLELYYVADKYEMMDLKKECTNFMKNSLSLTNICKVIQLALNHTDSGLLEYTTDYFIKNVLEIMHTVEWQLFMKDNLTVANELLIKAFKYTKR